MSRVLAKTRFPLRVGRQILKGSLQCRKAATAGSLPSKSGYVVLLPEVPHDSPKTNQLMRIFENPEFDQITQHSCRNALGIFVLQLESLVWRMEEELKDPEYPRTYDEIIDPIEKLSVPFDYVWSIIKTLSLVKNDFLPTGGYLDLHERGRLARSKKFRSLAIYHACKEIKADPSRLQDPQRRAVDKYLLEGKLSGVELTGDNQTQLNIAGKTLKDAQKSYAENVEKTTKAFQQVLIDPQYIGEMPVHLLRNLSRDKTQPSKGPWIVTLQDKIYKSFMEYCPERALRWNAWLAYNSRASGLMEQKVNNSINIEEIRMKRTEQAKLVGFDNYAEMSMQTKMAGSLGNVKAFLATLFTTAKGKRDEDMDALHTFAASRGFDSTFKPWDIEFWKRKQRSSLYAFDEFVASEYFPLPHVWKSLCNFAEELFCIKITQMKTSTWHEDVSYYEIADGTTGAKMGGFYMDAYTRPQEKATGGAWMITHKNRCGIPNVNPLATLVFNFNPPIYGKPSLLTFSEVYTLFERFGQVLQHILTTVTFNEVAGTNNIEWDAVLVSSKFMSMWLGNKAIVREISSHFDSGNKLSDEQIRDLLRARKHMAAFDLCHQVYLSSLDLELYSSKDFWKDILTKQWQIYKEPLPLDKKDLHLCSTSEVFSGDYAAAYYSTLWSHMLAADVYQSFVEGNKGREKWKKQGLRFRASFLSMGGGYHPNFVFRACRGRDPCPDAFLWSLGLKPFPKGMSAEDVAKSDALDPLAAPPLDVRTS